MPENGLKPCFLVIFVTNVLLTVHIFYSIMRSFQAHCSEKEATGTTSSPPLFCVLSSGYIVLGHPSDVSARHRVADPDMVVPGLLSHDADHIAVIQLGITCQPSIALSGACPYDQPDRIHIVDSASPLSVALRRSWC